MLFKILKIYEIKILKNEIFTFLFECRLKTLHSQINR